MSHLCVSSIILFLLSFFSFLHLGALVSASSPELGAFIGGGFNNTASANYSVVTGGHSNSATANFSAVTGGHDNANDGISGFIGGGSGHFLSAKAQSSTIVGGEAHLVTRAYSFIGGGKDNQARATFVSMVGGLGNYVTAAANFSTIGGGNACVAQGPFATVSGGMLNSVIDEGGTVSGGLQNVASGKYCTIAGGTLNSINPPGDHSVPSEATPAAASSIGGGMLNSIRAWHSHIGGGMLNNINESNYSGILGGDLNYIMGGVNSVIGGGKLNNIQTNSDGIGNYNVIVGGRVNVVSAYSGRAVYSAVLSGELNSIIEASYSSISGGKLCGIGQGSQFSSIIGGELNTIDGNYSHIAGGKLIRVEGDFNSVGGGELIASLGNHNSIGGGKMNSMVANYVSIGGGFGVQIDADYATVSGGSNNTVSGTSSAITGGNNNVIKGILSNIGGGESNSADGDYVSVIGGRNNSAMGHMSSVLGGGGNVARNFRSMAGGMRAEANGVSSVALGVAPVASGRQSWAVGERARAVGDQSVAWGSDITAKGRGSYYYDGAIKARSLSTFQDTRLRGNERAANGDLALATLRQLHILIYDFSSNFCKDAGYALGCPPHLLNQIGVKGDDVALLYPHGTVSTDGDIALSDYAQWELEGGETSGVSDTIVEKIYKQVAKDPAVLVREVLTPSEVDELPGRSNATMADRTGGAITYNWGSNSSSYYNEVYYGNVTCGIFLDELLSAEPAALGGPIEDVRSVNVEHLLYQTIAALQQLVSNTEKKHDEMSEKYHQLFYVSIGLSCALFFLSIGCAFVVAKHIVNKGIVKVPV